MALFSCCSFLSEEEGSILAGPVLEDEIRLGLWALKPFKAPGPDGLHAGFFQYFWNDVKNSVCMEVSNIFESRVIPEFINKLQQTNTCSKPQIRHHNQIKSKKTMYIQLKITCKLR